MKIADKTTSAVSLIKSAFEKVKKYSEYNIFTQTFEEEALEKAKEIDARIQKGESVGRLAGVPFAAKDNFLTRLGTTTASAHILEPFSSPINATIISQLESEDAILIGKTNLDAFAHGSSTENSYFGPTLNSKDTTRVAGGSSGGSAVAVALDIVPFATGSDTGGSIRQPASFNGVYGLKPTYGATSRYGVVAMASSTDSMGFFTRTPEDMNLLMQICAHHDEKDMTSLPDFYDAHSYDEFSKLSRENILSEPHFDNISQEKSSERSEIKNFSPDEHVVKMLGRDTKRLREEGLENSSANIRIGIIRDFDNDSIHPEIRKAMDSTIASLEKSGYEIVPLDMPTLKYALAVYYVIVPAEVTSNLSRYDGIRYGFRSDNARDLADIYEHTRDEGFMRENKRRIMIGNFVLSSGFYDAYYLKAAKVRTLIRQEYEESFKKCDFILTPVSPNPAFHLGEKVDDPVAMYLEDVMSTPVNLAGLPALAFPVGQTEDGLDLGLQLIGPRRSDRAIIDFVGEISKISGRNN